MRRKASLAMAAFVARAVLLLGILLVPPSAVLADPPTPPSPQVGGVPPQMSFQGRLVDDQGQPINGTIQLVASMYDAAEGGTRVWGPENHPEVFLSDGVFSVFLGQLAPMTPEVLSESAWVEVEINGEVLAPRQPVVSTAYALSLIHI